ncbi:IclR family transcriptional regulator [Salinisphaera aquimarina]|uniref:IclR family transcriptional regulator n=1 Tax=Salinisphaera aquimarina TaxID=2094031 RepID=A0ABV7EJD5_9GAMM
MARSRLFVGSLEKATRVLYAFTEHSASLSHQELVTATGLDRSSVQRFTHSLTELGMLGQHPDTRRFYLGKRILELAWAYLHSHPLIDRAMPTILALREKCQERVNLSLFDDTTLIYVVRQLSRQDYPEASLVGRRMPLFCTAGGRAMLAQLEDTRVDEILRRSDRRALTPHTLTTLAAVRREVKRARRNGYALAVEECVPGELTLGKAIVDRHGEPMAAIHIAATRDSWSPEDFRAQLAPLLIEAADSLNRSPMIQQRP